MNNFIFENATKTVFGKGCVKEYLSCIVSHYGENVMFCYGGGSVKNNGVYEEITGCLKKAGKNIIEFPGITPNPTYSKVMEGAKLARENNVHLILAAGGGSVMDCCKAISLAAVYKGDIWADFWARPGVIDFNPLPLGVVVTAAGTGSEMTGGAVITNEALKMKFGRDYPRCNPAFALMDPSYTLSVPKQQMVSGGFDTLSHIMEAYFSRPDGDNVSDDLAEALMRGVIRDLRAAIKNPEDYTARSNLMWESSMAKNRIIKLGKQLDFQCHYMVHQLEAYTNCSHSEGMAVVQPVYYLHICETGAGKFSRFAQNIWGVPYKSITKERLALAGVEALEDFIREIGMPSRLGELGISSETDLKAIANSCTIVNSGYRRMSHEEIYQIFTQCL